MKELLWIIPALALVACQTEEQQEVEVEIEAPEGETSPEPTEEETPEVAFDVNDAQSLVGQSFDKVEPALKAAEIKYRVIERDGESFPMTMDLLPERLNFKINDGVITAVTKG